MHFALQARLRLRLENFIAFLPPIPIPLDSVSPVATCLEYPAHSLHLVHYRVRRSPHAAKTAKTRCTRRERREAVTQAVARFTLPISMILQFQVKHMSRQIPSLVATRHITPNHEILYDLHSVSVRRRDDAADGVALGGLHAVPQVDLHRPPLFAPTGLGALRLLLGVAAVAALQRHRRKVSERVRKTNQLVGEVENRVMYHVSRFR